MSLYKRREKIFVHYVGGHFQKIRLYTGWPLLLGYFALPWGQWHGRQAVLFDLPERKFYLLGVTLWPQDFMLLAWLLIIAALALFLVTSMVGRLWCGYTCPQTVWTSVFLWVEKAVEGPSHRRRKLDAAAMSTKKFLKKTTKHSLWLGFAFLTGFTFVAYFVPARQLGQELFQLSASYWSIAWIVFFTLATYINAGWLREQVCIYMCPYARFQSAMVDKDTLVVTYDALRGEPRGSRKRAAAVQDLGDCVDCKLCVQVCPTGIDIRKGLQIECIQCAHCIDACNQVMDKMNYETGLIRYDSENNVQSGSSKPPNFFRARTIGYGLVLTVMVGVFLVKLGTRMPLALEVLRDRGSLFHETADGIRNDYTLKIANKSQRNQRYTLDAIYESALLRVDTEQELEVPAGEVVSIGAGIFVANESLKRPISKIVLKLCESDLNLCTSTETRFIGPG